MPKIPAILIALATGLLFGFFGTIFNLSSSEMKLGIPSIVGTLAAFLTVRRASAVARKIILKSSKEISKKLWAKQV